MADPHIDGGDSAATPRWVKVSGAILAGAILLVGLLMLSGHGPGRHTSARDASVKEHAPGTTP